MTTNSIDIQSDEEETEFDKVITRSLRNKRNFKYFFGSDDDDSTNLAPLGKKTRAPTDADREG